jgi:DNA repair protein RadA/Sms
LGFKEIWISKYNAKGLDVDSYKIKVRMAAKLEDVFMQILRNQP